MNYKRIYKNIIENRLKKEYIGYTESHHIIPKCLGGSNLKSNLVRLSAKEHFICHLLLTKIYTQGPAHCKMIRAFVMMMRCSGKGQERYITSFSYQQLKEKYSKIQSISQTGNKNSQYGKPRSEDTKRKISHTLTSGLGTKVEQRKIRTALKRENKIRVYREYYNLYKSVGFDEFVKITNYPYSKPNLVSTFTRLLPEFEPQNGKKRGYSL